MVRIASGLSTCKNLQNLLKALQYNNFKYNKSQKEAFKKLY